VSDGLPRVLRESCFVGRKVGYFLVAGRLLSLELGGSRVWQKV